MRLGARCYWGRGSEGEGEVGGREEAAEAEALTHRQAGAAVAPVSDPAAQLGSPSSVLHHSFGVPKSLGGPLLISDPRYLQSSPSFPTIPADPQP